MNDYESDIEFGQWIKDIRLRWGLSLEDAASSASMPAQRLKELENGQSNRGITQKEAKNLATAYRLSLDEVLKHASGEED